MYEQVLHFNIEVCYSNEMNNYSFLHWSKTKKKTQNKTNKEYLGEKKVAKNETQHDRDKLINISDDAIWLFELLN